MQVSLGSEQIIYSLADYGVTVTGGGSISAINPVKRLQRVRGTVSYNTLKYEEYGSKYMTRTGDSFDIARIEMEFNVTGDPYPLAYFVLHSGIDDYEAGGDLIITETNLADNAVDLVEYIPTDVNRTVFYPYLRIERIEANYSVRGVVQERYAFVGQKPFECSGTLGAVRGTDVSGNSFVVNINDTTITPRYVLNHGLIIASGTDIVVNNGVPDSAKSTVEVPATINFPFDVVFVFDISEDKLSYLEPDGRIGGLRKKNVKIYLVDSGTNFEDLDSGDRLLGVQDVGIGIRLDYVEILEYGNDNIFDRIMRFPIDVEIRLSVLERDLANYYKYSNVNDFRWLGAHNDKKLFVVFENDGETLAYLEYPDLRYVEFLSDITVRGDRLMYYNFRTDRLTYKFLG